MATPLFGGSLAPPQQERSFTQKLGRALSGFGAGYAGEGRQYLEDVRKQDELQQQKIMGATIQDALELRRALETNDTSTAMGLLDDRVKLLTDMGQDASDTVALQNELMNGNVRGVVGEVDQFLSGAKRAGYLQPKQIDPSKIYQGMIVSQDPVTGEVTTKPINPNEEYIDPEIKADNLREVRSRARTLDASVDELTTAFNKISGLEKGMRAGNRGSINAAIMNLARLISPGVVTDRDVAQLSGAETPIGLLYNTLQGKGVNMGELLKVYDPSNPQTFDVDALLSTARSVTGAAIPSILSGYSDLENTAKNFQAPNAMMRSFFNPESARMTGLREIEELVSGMPSMPASPKMSRDEIFAAAAAGTLEPGQYSYPDPENPGSELILEYRGQ